MRFRVIEIPENLSRVEAEQYLNTAQLASWATFITTIQLFNGKGLIFEQDDDGEESFQVDLIDEKPIQTMEDLGLMTKSIEHLSRS